MTKFNRIINYSSLPKVLCPGIDRVAGIQNGSPVVALMCGKYGSPSGTGIGKHCGCTVIIESHDRQFSIPSFMKPVKNEKLKFIIYKYSTTH